MPVAQHPAHGSGTALQFYNFATGEVTRPSLSSLASCVFPARRQERTFRLGRFDSVAIIDFKPDSPEGPPKEFRFTPAQIESEMSKAGYVLTAEHDFLPRQQFLIFAIAGHPSQ